MDTDLLKTAAFFDELQKISAAQDYLQQRDFEQEKQSEGVPEDSQWITKKKLKRLAIMLPAVGAGAGLGRATGRKVKEWMLNPQGAPSPLRRLARAHPTVGRYIAPTVAGAAAASAPIVGALALMRAKKVKDWIEGGNEGKRSK